MPAFRRCVVLGFSIATAIAALPRGDAFSAQEAIERPPDITEDVPRSEAPPPVIEEISQDEEAATDDRQRSRMEEIIVIAPKPGDRRQVDEEYEDPVRARILKDFYRMQQLREEYEWRKAGADDSSSRIRWGYDPRDDYRMRNEMSLQELSWEKTKPATIFSIEF